MAILMAGEALGNLYGCGPPSDALMLQKVQHGKQQKERHEEHYKNTTKKSIFFGLPDC
jgi:hypothetical protein